MKRKSIKKWTLGIFGVLVIVSLASCFGVKSQIDHQQGKNTEVINSSIFKTSSSPVAIKNVHVLSPDCTKILDGFTVMVKNGKIVTVAKDVNISSEYKIIDGTGQYLIPGLIDTHIHLKKSKNDLLLYLANGVTAIGEMTGNEQHLEWSHESEKGALSPYIYVSSNKLGSTKGLKAKIKSWFAGRKNYTTVKKARKAVRKYKEQGYDAIKLSTHLEPKIYHAIVDEAKKQNIPTIGHLSLSVGLENFYTSGQSQLAHVEEIIKNTMEDYTGIVYNTPNEYLNYLNENSDSIAMKLKKNNIAVSSTIWLIESLPRQKFDIENFLKTIKLEYANPGLVEGSRMGKGWLPGNNSYENLEIKNDPETSKKVLTFWNTYVKANQIMVKALIKHNVTLLAGTDANVTGAVPGFSLHDELESLNKAGLTTAQVLHSATTTSAKWMQVNAGKIEVGSRADLVLLAENPLEDIKNTRTINAVIANGKFLDRVTLDQILQAIKDTNNRNRRISIDAFIN